MDEFEKIKAKKLQIENAIKLEFETEIRRIDELKGHLASETQLLSDMALTTMMRGESVQIVDENDQKYDPIFNVRFKKSG